MDPKSLILAGMLFTGFPVGTRCVVAQTATPQIYTLLAGSQLTDDCPICDRIPIVVPLTGTFGLRLLDQNPLFIRYELLNISFHAGANPGPEYSVIGKGIYQVGGEVALVQNLCLDVGINNGFTNTEALCVNADPGVMQPWPKIQVSVDQTNGTPGQVYHLALIAAPAAKLNPLVFDRTSGSVRLDWVANGGEFQLERAPGVGGPYSALTKVTTNSSFTDVGVLTNQAHAFYRLRQF